MEQPWQQTKAEMWNEVTETLCNLDFIQAKSCAKQTYDLVKDYHFALAGLPEFQSEKEKERKRQDRMEKYTRDLIAYAKGEIKNLDIPESLKPWSKERKELEIKQIKNSPKKLDRLNAFRNFLGQESNNLQQNAHQFAHFAYQQAWNYADSGPVGKAAEQMPSQYKNRLLLKTPFTRPLYNPLPQQLQTLAGHTGSVNAISITPDGLRALSGSDDTTLKLWNLESGECLQTLAGHTSYVTIVSLTPDGHRAISGSGDSTIKLWNLESGECLQTLAGLQAVSKQ